MLHPNIPKPKLLPSNLKWNETLYHHINPLFNPMWWCIKLFSKVTIFQLSNKWHWFLFFVFLKKKYNIPGTRVWKSVYCVLRLVSLLSRLLLIQILSALSVSWHYGVLHYGVQVRRWAFISHYQAVLSFVLLTRFICHFNRNISYLAFEWWIYLVICLLYFMESTDMVNITVDRLFSSLRWAQGDKNKLSTALITKPCLVMFSS